MKKKKKHQASDWYESSERCSRGYSSTLVGKKASDDAPGYQEPIPNAAEKMQGLNIVDIKSLKLVQVGDLETCSIAAPGVQGGRLQINQWSDRRRRAVPIKDDVSG